MALKKITEIDAMGSINDAFEALVDEQARQRVLDWAIAKYGGTETRTAKTPKPPLEDLAGEKELAGLGVISENGSFELTVRDPKAKNTNDAAIRLALVAIHVYCKLTGEKTASSKKIVKPILEEWRAYTGNTRNALAQHKGVLRSGDALSLDQHAKRDAEKYIKEILDDTTVGAWQPTGAKTKRSKNEKRKADD